jgi:hypothetical protein
VEPLLVNEIVVLPGTVRKPPAWLVVSVPLGE